MNDRLTSIDGDVAAAADAWLNDPLDTGIYGRLVAAVGARRAALQTPDPAGVAPGGEVAAEVEPDEVHLTDEDHRSVRPVSDLLSGDPRAALERLRRGAR